MSKYFCIKKDTVDTICDLLCELTDVAILNNKRMTDCMSFSLITEKYPTLTDRYEEVYNLVEYLQGIEDTSPIDYFVEMVNTELANLNNPRKQLEKQLRKMGYELDKTPVYYGSRSLQEAEHRADTYWRNKRKQLSNNIGGGRVRASIPVKFPVSAIDTTTVIRLKDSMMFKTANMAHSRLKITGVDKCCKEYREYVEKLQNKETDDDYIFEEHTDSVGDSWLYLKDYYELFYKKGGK